MQKTHENKEKTSIKLKIYIHILVMGDLYTGKSSLIRLYKDNCFFETGNMLYLQPVCKDVETPKGKITLFIREYDGRIRPINESVLLLFDHFPSYRELFLHYSLQLDYIILLFDSTKRSSFEGINEYLELIKKRTTKPLKIYLLGTKYDKYKDLQVTIEEAEKFAKDNNIKFSPVSCKTEFGIDNIKQIFNDIANHYINTESFEEQMNKKEKEAKLFHDKNGKKCSIQ